MNVLNTIKTAWNTTRYFVVKHAPTILTVAGTVSTVAGTFFACKSTLKLNDLMAERDAEKAAIEEAHEKGLDGYSEQDYKKDLIKCKTTTVKELAKLYWVPAACTVLGVTGILSGHGMMRSRNAALGAAVVGLERAFNGYRERVKGVIGSDEEAKLRFPANDIVVHTEHVDEDSGEVVTEDHVEKTVITGPNEYSAIWGPNTANYATLDGAENKKFLIRQQNYWNDVLKSRRPYPVFLNEVLADIGLDKTQVGQIAGWKDGPIDFGLDKNPHFNAEFNKGVGVECFLDFNCEGNVLVELPDSACDGGTEFSFRRSED